ncbi:MAG: protein kinase, partial [Planctomycetaceae bacterium]|nr:protein kinase [Planctomycetaceae bacterium]
MVPSECPSDDDLTAYFTGRLPLAIAGDMERHLAGCSHCARTYHQVNAETDPLLAAIRTPVNSQDVRVLEEPLFQAAVESAAELTVTNDGRSGSAAQANVDQLIGKRLGQYQLLDLIGQGGMGRVYRARHLKLDRIAAVKVLPQSGFAAGPLVQRFEREMKAVGRLQHPNIVQAFDADEVDGVHFLAMEFVEGIDLSALLKREGPLSVCNACEIVRQAATALQHAYENGLVHRDIKPANLILSTHGTVKLLDLGLALLQDKSALASSELTSTGQLMGTIDYMAPEQAENTHTVDIRADIYSLGATLYALLAGHAPFASGDYKSLLSKMAALAAETARPIRELRQDVPDQLDQLLQQMLSRDQEQRPTPPAMIATRLASFCSGADLSGLFHGEKPAAAVDFEFSAQTQDQKSNLTSEPDFLADTVAAPVQSRASRRRSTGAPAGAIPPTDAADESSPRTDSRRRLHRPIIAGLAVIGFLLAGLLIRVKTPIGTVVLELNQQELAGASVSIDDRKVISISTGDGDETIRVTPDSETHLLKVTKGGFQTFTREFTFNGKAETRIHVFLERLAESNPEITRPSSPVASPGIVRTEIDPYELKVAGLGDADNASAGLVAVFGDSRFMQSTRMDAVAGGPNGKAATVGEGGILVWDVESGEIIRRFPSGGPSFQIGKPDWNSNSNRIAALAVDGRMLIVDETTGDILQPTGSKANGNGVVAFSPDGDRIATGHDNGTILFWDPASGDIQQTCPHLNARVRDLEFSPDGSRIAVVHETPGDPVAGTVRLYSVPDGEIIAEFTEHKQSPQCVCFEASGDRIISGDTKEIYIWNAVTGELRQTISMAATDCICRNEELFIQNADIVRWNLSTNQEVGRVSGLRCSSMDIGTDGIWIVAGDERTQRLSVVPVSEIHGHVNRSPPGPGGVLSGMDLSPDGSLLAMGGEFSNDVEIWDVRTGVKTAVAGAVSTGGITRLTFSGDGSRIGVVGQYALAIVDIATRRQLVEQVHKIRNGTAIQFLPDDRQLFTASPGSPPRMWDSDTLTESELPPGLPGGTLFSQLSPSGDLVAICTTDEVSVREPATMKAIWQTPLQAPVAAWHPNSRFLATGAQNVVVHDTTAQVEDRVL